MLGEFLIRKKNKRGLAIVLGLCIILLLLGISMAVLD
jgi:hypothetical protein